MTYGWAILVVMIIIGSLYAMGIFSPSVPNSCKIDQPFTCVDVKADSVTDKLTFAISSSGVDTVTSAAVKNGVADCPGVVPAPPLPPPSSYLEKLRDSDVNQQLVEFQCPSLTKRDVAKGTIEILWGAAGSLGHTAVGSYYAKIE